MVTIIVVVVVVLIIVIIIVIIIMILTNIGYKLEGDGVFSFSQNVQHMVRCLTLHVDPVYFNHLIIIMILMMIMIIMMMTIMVRCLSFYVDPIYFNHLMMIMIFCGDNDYDDYDSFCRWWFSWGWTEFMSCDKLDQFSFPRHPSSVHCSGDHDGRNQISEVMGISWRPSSYPLKILSNLI